MPSAKRLRIMTCGGRTGETGVRQGIGDKSGHPFQHLARWNVWCLGPLFGSYSATPPSQASLLGKCIEYGFAASAGLALCLGSNTTISTAVKPHLEGLGSHPRVLPDRDRIPRAILRCPPTSARPRWPLLDPMPGPPSGRVATA